MEEVQALLSACPDPLVATRTNHALHIIRRSLALYG
jgi:hypothetical protein